MDKNFLAKLSAQRKAAAPEESVKPEAKTEPATDTPAVTEPAPKRTNPLFNLHKRQTAVAVQQEKASELLAPVEEDKPIDSGEQSIEDIAAFDTSKLKPTVDPQSKESTALARARQAVIKGPEDFKKVANALDELIGQDEGIDMLTLSAARSYVKVLATSINENPELDSLMLARDVRNVIRTMRTLQAQAEAAQEVKLEKRVKRASKKKSSAKADKFAKVDIGALAASFTALKKDG